MKLLMEKQQAEREALEAKVVKLQLDFNIQETVNRQLMADNQTKAIDLKVCVNNVCLCQTCKVNLETNKLINCTDIIHLCRPIRCTVATNCDRIMQCS